SLPGGAGGLADRGGELGEQAGGTWGLSGVDDGGGLGGLLPPEPHRGPLGGGGLVGWAAELHGVIPPWWSAPSSSVKIQKASPSAVRLARGMGAWAAARMKQMKPSTRRTSTIRHLLRVRAAVA